MVDDRRGRRLEHRFVEAGEVGGGGVLFDRLGDVNGVDRGVAVDVLGVAGVQLALGRGALQVFLALLREDGRVAAFDGASAVAAST